MLSKLIISHGKSRSDWMGVFHASAVSDGKEALLFVADSGSGKSTLAALLVAHGFQLVSDDFVPVALEPPEIYPLPAAISVKENAIPILKRYFPSLQDGQADGEDINSEVFLPLPDGSLAPYPVKTKAIFLLKYDPDAEFQMVRESNLAAMNAILKQTWLAHNSRAAERFLQWYFNLPVYALTYSDNKKMVREINCIFGDINENKL